MNSVYFNYKNKIHTHNTTAREELMEFYHTFLRDVFIKGMLVHLFFSKWEFVSTIFVEIINHV